MTVTYHYSLSEAYENLGRVALQRSQKERGHAYLRDALAIYEELAKRGAISAEYAEVPARIRREMK
jgi:Tfp pilus assembly protein PilF